MNTTTTRITIFKELRTEKVIATIEGMYEPISPDKDCIAIFDKKYHLNYAEMDNIQLFHNVIAITRIIMVTEFNNTTYR